MDYYSIVFSDVDGTLLDSDLRVSSGARQKIRELSDMGIPFVLASARKPQGIRILHEELGFRAPSICYGGALLLGSSYQPIYSRGLEQKEALRVRQAIRESGCGVCASVYHYDLWIVDDKDDPWVAHERSGIEQAPIEGDPARILEKGDKIHKVSCLGRPAEIGRLHLSLKRAFPGLSVIKSADNCLEIMHPLAGKARAALYLCKHLGIPVQRAVAFGDHENDLDLLLQAGLGVAMGNAPREIREAVRHVTADNDHAGVLHGLEKLVFRAEDGWGSK